MENKYKVTNQIQATPSSVGLRTGLAGSGGANAYVQGLYYPNQDVISTALGVDTPYFSASSEKNAFGNKGLSATDVAVRLPIGDNITLRGNVNRVELPRYNYKQDNAGLAAAIAMGKYGNLSLGANGPLGDVGRNLHIQYKKNW